MFGILIIQFVLETEIVTVNTQLLETGQFTVEYFKFYIFIFFNIIFI